MVVCVLTKWSEATSIRDIKSGETLNITGTPKIVSGNTFLFKQATSTPYNMYRAMIGIRILDLIASTGQKRMLRTDSHILVDGIVPRMCRVRRPECSM